jgi:hypothetical protein
MKQSLAIQLNHTNTITFLNLVINLFSSLISIICILAFAELINRTNKKVKFSEQGPKWIQAATNNMGCLAQGV